MITTSDYMLSEKVHLLSFCYPVVPSEGYGLQFVKSIQGHYHVVEQL